MKCWIRIVYFVLSYLFLFSIYFCYRGRRDDGTQRVMADGIQLFSRLLCVHEFYSFNSSSQSTINMYAYKEYPSRKMAFSFCHKSVDIISNNLFNSIIYRGIPSYPATKTAPLIFPLCLPLPILSPGHQSLCRTAGCVCASHGLCSFWAESAKNIRILVKHLQKLLSFCDRKNWNLWQC